jgi:hypothetical protein
MDTEGLRCDKIADCLLPSCVHFNALTPAVPRSPVFNVGYAYPLPGGMLRHFVPGGGGGFVQTSNEVCKIGKKYYFVINTE